MPRTPPAGPLVRWLPERVGRAAFRIAADLAWRRQRRCTPARRQPRPGGAAGRRDLDGLGRDAMRSYARYWLEVFRLPVTRSDRIVGQMYVRDEHMLRDAHAAGKGMILALPHMGNWDHAGAWLVHRRAVHDRGRTPGAGGALRPLRRVPGRAGLRGLALSGERATAVRGAQRTVAGRRDALPAGRPGPDPAGVPVTFFGAEATMPAGPAALALRTGAALMPMTLWYPEDGGPGWRARIHGADRRTPMSRR